MREFNPLTKGIKPKALESIYHIVLVQKLANEAKLERIKKELAVFACAVDDGQVDLEQAKNGMMNLIAYIETKIEPEKELNHEKGSLEIVNEHLKSVKDFYENKKRN